MTDNENQLKLWSTFYRSAQDELTKIENQIRISLYQADKPELAPDQDWEIPIGLSTTEGTFTVIPQVIAQARLALRALLAKYPEMPEPSFDIGGRGYLEVNWFMGPSWIIHPSMFSWPGLKVDFFARREDGLLEKSVTCLYVNDLIQRHLHNVKSCKLTQNFQEP